MTSTVSNTKSKKKDTKNKSVDTELLKRLYAFIEPYKWFVVLAVLLTLSAALLGTIRPKLTQIAVDDYIINKDLDGLWYIILLLTGALIGEFFILVANTYITRWFGQGALYSLRNAIFEKIQSLHVQFFDRNPIGRLITRTTNDIEALSDLLSAGVVNIIGDSFRIIFILYFMFTMNWELTFIALLTLPVLFYATFIFKAKVRVSFLNVRDQIARLNSFLQENISGMGIIQLFNKEKRAFNKYEKINRQHQDAHINTIFYFAIFWPTIEILASLSMALVLLYGGGQAFMGEVTFGILLAFIQYVRQFFMPIRGLSERFNTLQSALASSERLFNILDIENEVVEPDKPIFPGNKKGHIIFDDVYFKYNEREGYVLKGINFEARPGETVAIVGATGAGKTTIINLLLRFYDINKGRIKIDDTDIQQLKISNLRSYFALVLQDNALFSGTVMENITLGNPDISRKKVISAAKMVEADRFIKRLPNGYDYMLRERGASISMGQQQLLCFLRALVYNPQILILDEATSNVDSETEEIVNNACGKLMEGRTSIVIAHRLSTIQHADKILVMHKGEIRETGTHYELIKQEGGIYKKLYELQYRDQLKEKVG